MNAAASQFDYKETFSLKGKVALLTGAGGHLGSYMAFCLGQAGAHVILNGRNSEKLLTVQGNLNHLGIESTLLPFDITDVSLLKEKVNFIGTNFKQLDIIVNNAHQGKSCAFLEAQSEDFFRDYAVDVVASYNLIKHCVPLLTKAVALNQDASVINIASMYGMVSPDPHIYSDPNMSNPPFYGPSKAGLLQLTRYMACYLSQQKIRVNAISPGPFPRDEMATQHPSLRNNLIAKVPLGRVGHPGDLQGPLLFLASRASMFVTGINLPVDGGWTAW